MKFRRKLRWQKQTQAASALRSKFGMRPASFATTWMLRNIKKLYQ